MDIQSLLFSRADGWTAAKAKAWAKSHGYKHSKVHVTAQYVRIRQFDPKGLKVKRTITLGRGIRAVVARETEMKRRKKSSARGPRRAKRVHAVAAKRRPRRHVRAATKVAAPRRRRRAPAGMVMQAPRRRRRRHVRATVQAWHGAKKRHASAARKGWAKRKRRSAPKRRRRARESFAYEAAPRRRRRRHARAAVAEARRPRRHRRRRARAVYATEARRTRRRSHRRHRVYAARGGGGGMGMGELAAAVISGGFGFVFADAVDRWLATYDPAKPPPANKFTSQGVGTLANTLNIASTPNWQRFAAAAGSTALPAVASMYVRNRMIKSSLEGAAIGAGVKAFQLIWNNLLMPMLKPKDAVAMQKSIIARLYPAEVSAKMNLDSQQTAAPAGTAFGALSGADVGPFALGGSSPYPDAAQALRAQAGVQGPGGDYPSMQNVWGTGMNMAQPGYPGVSDYPTTAQAMGTGATPSADAGVPYQPGPPAGFGPGPQARPHSDPSCGCIGDSEAAIHAAFLGDAEEKDTLYNVA